MQTSCELHCPESFVWVNNCLCFINLYLAFQLDSIFHTSLRIPPKKLTSFKTVEHKSTFQLNTNHLLAESIGKKLNMSFGVRGLKAVRSKLKMPRCVSAGVYYVIKSNLNTFVDAWRCLGRIPILVWLGCLGLGPPVNRQTNRQTQLKILPSLFYWKGCKILRIEMYIY